MDAAERTAQAVIDEIVGRPLLHGECVEGEAHGVVVTWNATAVEQLAAVIERHVAEEVEARVRKQSPVMVGWHSGWVGNDRERFRKEADRFPWLELAQAAALFVVGVAAFLAGVLGVFLAAYATAAMIGML